MGKASKALDDVMVTDRKIEEPRKLRFQALWNVVRERPKKTDRFLLVLERF